MSGCPDHPTKCVCTSCRQQGRCTRHDPPPPHPSIATITQLRTELEASRLECERLRVDAERYQEVRRGQHWSVINGIGDELRGEALDTAVDAMKKDRA